MEPEDGALFRDLAPLRDVDVAPAGEDRTRTRCRALLARRQRRTAGVGIASTALERLFSLLEPALVSALVVLYLGGAIEKALLVLAR